jgi:hypothetical protein
MRQQISTGLVTLLLSAAMGCTSDDGGAASASNTGGATEGGAGGASGSAGPGGTGGSSATAGGAGSSSSGTGGGPSACPVTQDRIRITEVDVGGTIVSTEDEVALKPLTISPIPSGGSRLAWMGDDGMVHITQLDANDEVTGASFGLPAHDYADLHADDAGGVLLLTRDAMGGGNKNCGNINNLCGLAANHPTDVPCYDMYMVRFDGSKETWATKLTDSSAALPPYNTSPDANADVVFIWWYAHHGRIAWSGTTYAGYFGAAISVSQACGQPSTLSAGINIHQGDRMWLVGADGAVQDGGFGWGCSHSGYERVIWDPAASAFVPICKTDWNNQIGYTPKAFSQGGFTILPVDLPYANVGNLVTAVGGGYWLSTSNIRPGQPEGAAGKADVHLLHFSVSGGSASTADKDIILANKADENARAPHLAAYGANQLLAAWETSTSAPSPNSGGELTANDQDRKMWVQALDRATGMANGDALSIPVRGNRYQDFRAFPDGSVAYPAPGSTKTKMKILRVLPCGS